MRIATLGDLLLDVVVRLERPLVEGDDVAAEIATAPGGQAANVAAWATHLGARAVFVGRRGGDEAGRLVTEGLAAHGVAVRGPIGGRNGVVVSTVGPDGNRSMASDRGVATELRKQDLDPVWFFECAWLHVAGYSLLCEPIATAAIHAAMLTRAYGRVSVDLSASTAIETLGGARFRELLDAVQPDLIFGTETELEAIGGVFPAPEWVLKRGPHGIAVGRNGETHHYPAEPAEVVDTTGAGDALAAGYLLAGPELALEAAALCVAKVGAMP